MPAQSLKDILIQRIQSINDEAFLNALKVLTDAKIEHDNYQLSQFEQEKIKKAQQQYAQGETSSHDEVKGEIKEYVSFAKEVKPEKIQGYTYAF
ncbi:hypothetical protein [Adhaeribacter terreus]|uniref:Uncharacterized protein n=1 Tax=Adhaeribacter terreus TaxID=529703 RepID=A0ABW0EDK9_9BACT